MNADPPAGTHPSGRPDGPAAPSLDRPKQPRRHLGLGTALASAAQIAPLAASGGLGLAVARLYGTRGAGSLSLVMNLFDTALIVFAIGLGSGITFLVSRREWPLRSAASDTVRAAVILGCAGAGCGLAFFFATRHSVFRGVGLPLTAIAVAALPFALSWTFAGAMALGRDHYETYAAITLSQATGVLVAGIGLGAVFGLVGAITGVAAGHLIAAAVGWRWVRRQARGEDAEGPGAEPRRTQLRHATRFGLQAWGANLLQLLNYRLDIFLLGAVAGRSAVGVYQIAVSLTALGWVLPDAFQTVLFPRIADLDASAAAGRLSAEASDASAARAMRHSVLLTVPTTLALVIIVLLIPVVYGPAFHDSVEIGFILLPGVVVVGPAKVMSAVVTGRGFPRYALYATMITVPITVGLYVGLIPPLHAIGAAVASSISYAITMVLSLPILLRATQIRLRDALIPTHEDLADYMAAFRLARTSLRRA